MKVTYSQATVGFCPDLTNPSEQQIPLAVLVLGQSDSACFAGVAYRSVDLDLDPISRVVLDDVPALLKDYLDGALDSMKSDSDLSEVLHGLHSSLRNSLSVLHVSETTTVELADDIPESAQDLLREAIKQVSADQARMGKAQPRVASKRQRRRQSIDVWERGPDSVPCHP